MHVSLKHEWRGDARAARTLEAACLRLEQVREAELFFARDVTVAHVSWILNAGFRLSVGIFRAARLVFLLCLLSTRSRSSVLVRVNIFRSAIVVVVSMLRAAFWCNLVRRRVTIARVSRCFPLNWFSSVEELWTLRNCCFRTPHI